MDWIQEEILQQKFAVDQEDQICIITADLSS